MRYATSFLLVIIALFFVVPAIAPQSPDADFQNQLAQARQKLRAGKYDEAVKQFKRVVKQKPDSAEACLGLAEAYHRLGAYKDVVDTARRASRLTSDAILQTNAHNLAGVALVELGNDKPDSAKYREAEQEFRAAVELAPETAITHFNLGAALLKQGRDADGAQELKRCLELNPNETLAKTAQQYIENPRRARENYAPDFAFTTLQGEYISLDDLQGKVVLLDFWATWCPPCRESIPDLQYVAKKFAKDRVVVISISADEDEQAWRNFVAAKKMNWPQYWDKDGNIAELCKVHAFPTYLVLDGEGIVHRAIVGGSEFNAATIESEIRKRLKMLPPEKAKDSAAGN